MSIYPKALAERIDEVAQDAYSFSVDIGRDYAHCGLIAQPHPTKKYTYRPLNLGAVLSICAELIRERFVETEQEQK